MSIHISHLIESKEPFDQHYQFSQLVGSFLSFSKLQQKDAACGLMSVILNHYNTTAECTGSDTVLNVVKVS